MTGASDGVVQQPAVADYALLSDCHAPALVSRDGSVDWWCLPRFDAEPVCGRLLGGPDAGFLLLGPAGQAELVERAYLPGTAVLRTVWQVGASRLTLTEGMVSQVKGRLLPSTLLVRRMEATGGSA
ncbi:MAG: glycoside hydrolase family 15 protein, partial [Proteobacteria bacterium]|nr:glycoside hydrolase family 15 protein [Pseudomonadota bacterium]